MEVKARTFRDYSDNTINIEFVVLFRRVSKVHLIDVGFSEKQMNERFATESVNAKRNIRDEMISFLEESGYKVSKSEIGELAVFGGEK